MDSTTEKRCLEEISTLIFDANEKVSLKTISNSYLVHYDVALEALLKWLDQNKKKVKDLELEYLVRGYNQKGVFCISVASKERKAALENKWKDFKSQLYSIDSRSNTRKLILPDYEPIKVKTILLTPRSPRDLRVPLIPGIKEEPAAKKVEPANTKTPFNVMKPARKPEIKKEVKAEKKPKVVASPEKKTETIVIADEPVKDIKAEKQSPEQAKTMKGPAAKKNQLKNQKPVQKGSISSFFGNKPGTSKVVIEKLKEKIVEKVNEKPKIVKDEKIESKPRKRSSDEVIEAKEVDKKKKPAAKKIKLKELPGNKRSRIRVMQDSSDEDEEEDSNEPEEPESKFIKFDRELTPEEETSPVETKETPEKKPQAELNKRKSKRWVTKRYQDNGFIRTERIQEEYSESEDENDENRKKNSPTTKEKVPAANKSAEKKQAAVKPKPALTGKAKQGNITSFFTKK